MSYYIFKTLKVKHPEFKILISFDLSLKYFLHCDFRGEVMREKIYHSQTTGNYSELFTILKILV